MFLKCHRVNLLNSKVIPIYNRIMQIYKTSADITTEFYNAFCMISQNHFKNEAEVLRPKACPKMTFMRCSSIRNLKNLKNKSGSLWISHM